MTRSQLNCLVLKNRARWAGQRRRADQRSQGHLGTITPFEFEYPEVQLARERREERIDWLIDNWRTVLVGGVAGLGFVTYLAWPWLKRAYEPVKGKVKIDVRR